MAISPQERQENQADQGRLSLPKSLHRKMMIDHWYLPRQVIEWRGNSQEILVSSSRGQATGAKGDWPLQSGHDNSPRLSCAVAYCCAIPPLSYSLDGNGTISHQEAIEKAERELEIYREREMRQLESDFDKAVKRLTNKKDKDDEKTEAWEF